MRAFRHSTPALLIGGAALLAAGDLAAQSPTAPPGNPCGGAPGASAALLSGRAARVVDGKSFLLADGREVRLAAVETVMPVPGDEDEARVAAASAARTALEMLVLQRDVALRAAAASDRYGRLIAYAFVAGPAGDTLVQRELVAAGQAVVSPVALAAGCRAQLRDAERAARTAKLGLWGEPYAIVKPADDAADVLAEQGRFAVVSGRVLTVRESGGMVYVNFGSRWSQDFTVSILKRNERIFASAGLAPRALAGHRVEVRGWIEERGGPAIEAVRPEQIEIVQ
jgi:endonuclease YncB( thermonuclease family)